MSRIIDKVKENTMNGFYLDHPQGLLLLEIDLNDMLNAQGDNHEELIIENAEKNHRILFLETEVEDLRKENSLIRTRLFENQDDCN